MINMATKKSTFKLTKTTVGNFLAFLDTFKSQGEDLLCDSHFTIRKNDDPILNGVNIFDYESTPDKVIYVAQSEQSASFITDEILSKAIAISVRLSIIDASICSKHCYCDLTETAVHFEYDDTDANYDNISHMQADIVKKLNAIGLKLDYIIIHSHPRLLSLGGTLTIDG